MEMFVTCSKSLTSSRIIGILGRHDLDFPARRGKKGGFSGSEQFGLLWERGDTKQ